MYEIYYISFSFKYIQNMSYCDITTQMLKSPFKGKIIATRFGPAIADAVYRSDRSLVYIDAGFEGALSTPTDLKVPDNISTVCGFAMSFIDKVTNNEQYLNSNQLQLTQVDTGNSTYLGLKAHPLNLNFSERLFSYEKSNMLQLLSPLMNNYLRLPYHIVCRAGLLAGADVAVVQLPQGHGALTRFLVMGSHYTDAEFAWCIGDEDWSCKILRDLNQQKPVGHWLHAPNVEPTALDIQTDFAKLELPKHLICID